MLPLSIEGLIRHRKHERHAQNHNEQAAPIEDYVLTATPEPTERTAG